MQAEQQGAPNESTYAHSPAAEAEADPVADEEARAEAYRMALKSASQYATAQHQVPPLPARVHSATHSPEDLAFRPLQALDRICFKAQPWFSCAVLQTIAPPNVEMQFHTRWDVTSCLVRSVAVPHLPANGRACN